jgi:hypothetical protein
LGRRLLLGMRNEGGQWERQEGSSYRKRERKTKCKAGYGIFESMYAVHPAYVGSECAAIRPSACHRDKVMYVPWTQQ